MPTVFLSHSHADKPMARQICGELNRSGIEVWIDEAEIKIGGSLIQKIGDALENVDLLVALISRHSVKSAWVQKELNLAMTKETKGRKVIVLPVVIDHCEIPFFLQDKLYADLRDTSNFELELQKIKSAVFSHTQIIGTKGAEVKGTHLNSNISNQKSGQIVGERPFYPNRVEDAYFAFSAPRFQEKMGIFILVLTFSLLFFIGLLVAIVKKQPPRDLLLIYPSAIFLCVGALLAIFPSHFLQKVFYEDANLTVVLEQIKGFVFPFSQTWFKQYRLGKFNKRYRLGHIILTISVLLVVTGTCMLVLMAFLLAI